MGAREEPTYTHRVLSTIKTEQKYSPLVPPLRQIILRKEEERRRSPAADSRVYIYVAHKFDTAQK